MINSKEKILSLYNKESTNVRNIQIVWYSSFDRARKRNLEGFVVDDRKRLLVL